MPHFLSRLLFLLGVPALLLITPARAAGKSPGGDAGAPPEPMELHIKVHREGKTEIPLRVYGQSNEPLKYSIRIPPEHGKLSDPRPTAREVSVVVYEPPADLSITSDKFYYTVQSTQGVSGAVQVSLTIVDDPPKLAISDSLDFGRIRAGASDSRMLEISNHGGLIATGQVVVDAPWRIEGKSEYHLAAGEIAVFKLIFEPKEGRNYEGVARYTSDPTHSTTLRGVAEAAIAVVPDEWVLQQTPGDPQRSGTFQVLNQLDEPRTFQLKADSRLKIPAEITLAPHAKAEVTVEAAPGNFQSWETEIRITSRDFSIAVSVRVPVLGPILRCNTPAIAFGRLVTGKDGESSFELENVGGAPGAISWEIAPPFHVSSNSATLQAGERKSFPLKIDTKAIGRFRTWLQFSAGTQKFDLPVQAEVIYPQPQTPTSGSPATNSPGIAPIAPADPSATPPENKTFLPMEDLLSTKLPPGVQVTNITPTSAVIEWPVNLSPLKEFRPEMVFYTYERDHAMHTTWLYDNEDKVERRGSNYTLQLKGLWPGQPNTVRIRPIDGNGQVGDWIFMVRFLTPPKPPFSARFPGFSWLHMLLLLLAILLGWRGWKWWQDHKHFRI